MIQVDNIIVRRLRKLGRCERGGALAELAILVPFLAVMLAIVTEVGRYYQTYDTLTKATRVSARYLSNHSLSNGEINRAVSLAVCGKLSCNPGGGDELVKGIGNGPSIASTNICIESTANSTITVRIPRTNDCNPIAGAPSGVTPYNYQPLFSLGTLMRVPSFNFALPIAPRTTMFKVSV